ncbi:MAG: MaoC family dehydratase [Pseudomonadota bacterium]
MTIVKADDLKDWVGKETGVSDWIVIGQDRINQFADITEDHQFIHVDEAAAKQTPFGGTIAHGFLSLSMLSRLAQGNVLIVDGVQMGINYGFEKVRFITPVKAGKKIRGKFVLMTVNQRTPGQVQLKYAATVEIEGGDKPALVAEWLTVQVI